MFQLIPSSLLSLIFPLNCEICQQLLPFQNSLGLCKNCAKILPLIQAPHCVKCGRFSTEPAGKCGACEKDRYHFDRVHAACYYSGNIKKILCAFKFKRRRILFQVILQTALRFLKENEIIYDWAYIVPVPMELRKKFERGFNQAELIAKGISKSINTPYADFLASNHRQSIQSRLGKIERKENIKNGFRIKKNTRLDSGKILLVDDILTTGETASQCAALLKQAGASQVDVLVIARGL